MVSEISGSTGRVAWGIISDKFYNGKRIIILLMIGIITAICSVTVAILPETISFWALAPIISIFGFAISGFNGIWMNLASELVPKEQAGISSGFSILFGSAGVIVMPPLFGLLVDETGNYAIGWFFIAALMIVVLLILMIIHQQEKRKFKYAGSKL
ncbi:MFS transporter [Bacillus sp. V3-13]|uniref:MFS transporter n=1 Tax=Bacillus sp. V3-13 TaxID=2053728 RepID=UPI0021520876|nr:MFS transporter [Bacillus sp. V3-13]